MERMSDFFSGRHSSPWWVIAADPLCNIPTSILVGRWEIGDDPTILGRQATNSEIT
jgi:hypothetical protein